MHLLYIQVHNKDPRAQKRSLYRAGNNLARVRVWMADDLDGIGQGMWCRRTHHSHLIEFCFAGRFRDSEPVTP